MIVSPKWMDAAVCATTDPDLFFPEKGSNSTEAKKVCAVCPVAALCLDYAKRNEYHVGVWGGKSSRQRRDIRKPKEAA